MIPNPILEPVLSEVALGLYIGNLHQLDGQPFDCVLTLSSTMPTAPIFMRERRFAWGSPKLPSQQDLQTLTNYVDLSWGVLGQTTLIRDLTGLNRSSLIAGLAMLHHGHPHEFTLARLQTHSPLVLSNGSYRKVFDATPVRSAA